jgi:Na+/H+ antiporter NhaD/arsenite permease-like protein
MTPIGNPQNILIAAQSGIANPFLTFLIHLTIPTVLSILITYLILKFFYRKEITSDLIVLNQSEFAGRLDGYYDARLARIAVIILFATLAGFVLSEVLTFLKIASLSLGAVAIIGAAALYGCTGQRINILRSVNYSVLVFFAAMFVVMSAMWTSGAVSLIFGTIMPAPNPEDLVQSTAVISAASIGMSQILSNVPFVSIYNFVMTDSGFTGAHVDQWMVLAAASTIAGNLTILGAASNIIVIEAAEARRIPAFSYFEFLKIGSIVTAANIAIYYLFIVFL